MTSIIRKIRSRSRSKSIDSKRNDEKQRRPSSVTDYDKDNDKEEQSLGLHHCSHSSADSGVSSANEPSLSPDENALSDEHDCIGDELSGTLAFAETASTPTESLKEFCSSYDMPWDGEHSTVVNITFEVISAEVIKDGRSSHVNYTVLINPLKDGTKGNQTVIKRRYSDFQQLHQALRKRFSSVMSHISFPRKVLLGNFTSETIAKRSTAFEQYLSHLFSYFEIRYSQEYMNFFVGDGFHCAIQHFLMNEYSQAVPLLEKNFPVLGNLYGHFHPRVIQCICCLVICFMKLKLRKAACSCSELMLKCCIPENSSANDELRCAVLLSAIHVFWTAGKDKTAIEMKLEEMRKSGFNVEGAKDLRQVLHETFDRTTID